MAFGRTAWYGMGIIIDASVHWRYLYVPFHALKIRWGLWTQLFNFLLKTKREGNQGVKKP